MRGSSTGVCVMKLCHPQQCRVQPDSRLLCKCCAGMNSNELTVLVTRKPGNRWCIVPHFVKGTTVNCYKDHKGLCLFISIITLAGIWWQISQSKHPKNTIPEKDLWFKWSCYHQSNWKLSEIWPVWSCFQVVLKTLWFGSKQYDFPFSLLGEQANI